ncbi:imidazolonepropionase [candidate division WOR-3 bacterium]|nr:imidazolonepropionase [candidate division WOR-3 bacterium]
MTFDLHIRNASQVVTMDGDGLGVLEGYDLIIHEGIISKVCAPEEARTCTAERVLDAKGMVVMPGFVDCHTHLVFAGSRAGEFARRMRGESYEEIAREGGGILSTVKATRHATFEELYENAFRWLARMLRWGTTTIEIKSGYGLTLADELKQLSVIRSLGEEVPQTLVATFMGAHALPEEMSREEYVKEVIDLMLPEVAEKGLARFVDVFCDSIAFTNDETRRILKRAKELDLEIKLHVDEIEDTGGAGLAAELGALSAEHLVKANEDGLRAMAASGVIAVLLPATTFFLREKARPNVELMRELRMPMAVATDFNPGSSTVFSLPFAAACGALLDGLTLEEVLRGITINAARAVGMDSQIGSLEEGKEADLLLLDISTWEELLYFFNRNAVRTVIKKGEVVYAQ